MDEPCSREEMRACLEDLSKLNRWFLGYRPILRWLDSLNLQTMRTPLNLLDAGCGYGDTLRRIEAWAQDRRIPMKLTGCDLNPDAVAIAVEATPPTSKIQLVSADIFRFANSGPLDI